MTTEEELTTLRTEATELAAQNAHLQSQLEALLVAMQMQTEALGKIGDAIAECGAQMLQFSEGLERAAVE